MGRVTDTGARRKLARLFANIRAETPTALQSLGQELAGLAAARAPSPKEEFETMMYGDGNPDGIAQDTSPATFPEDDDGDGRARFIKAPQEYLQPWIAGDIHLNPDQLYVGLGYKPDLESISHYSWKNRGGTYTSDVGFIYVWEYGTPNNTFIISPRNAGKNQSLYPLRPSMEVQKPPIFYMVKTIPRKRMYGGVDGKTVALQVLYPAIRKAARDAQ